MSITPSSSSSPFGKDSLRRLLLRKIISTPSLKSVAFPCPRIKSTIGQMVEVIDSLIEQSVNDFFSTIIQRDDAFAPTNVIQKQSNIYGLLKGMSPSGNKLQSRNPEIRDDQARPQKDYYNRSISFSTPYQEDSATRPVPICFSAHKQQKRNQHVTTSNLSHFALPD